MLINKEINSQSKYPRFVIGGEFSTEAGSNATKTYVNSNIENTIYGPKSDLKNYHSTQNLQPYNGKLNLLGKQKR